MRDDDLIQRARWMLRNGMKPNHTWIPAAKGAYGCELCPRDSPFKSLSWAHPMIIEEDELP